MAVESVIRRLYEEIPGGGHAIPGVATSTTAFIGRTPRPHGRARSVPKHLRFERSFGGLWSASTVSYAVAQCSQKRPRCLDRPRCPGCRGCLDGTVKSGRRQPRCTRRRSAAARRRKQGHVGRRPAGFIEPAATDATGTRFNSPSATPATGRPSSSSILHRPDPATFRDAGPRAKLGSRARRGPFRRNW
jgi:hypothetical protein